MLTEEHKKKIAYLSQYRYLNNDINRQLEEAEFWRAKAEKITSTISDMPRSGAGNKDDIIVKIIDIENSINSKIDRLVDLKIDIECRINSVEDLQLRAVLTDRYICCKTMEEIAYINNYSWRHVHRLHEKSLEKINMS